MFKPFKSFLMSGFWTNRREHGQFHNQCL